MLQVAQSNEVHNLDIAITVRRRELGVLNKDIEVRAAYQRQQEKDIGQAAEMGAEVLRGLQYEILEAKAVLKDLKIDIRVGREDKRLLEHNLAIVQDQLIEADDRASGQLSMPEPAIG